MKKQLAMAGILAAMLDPTAGTYGRSEESDVPLVRTSSTEAERMRRKGLKRFEVDGQVVWATNLKNAKRKADQLNIKSAATSLMRP